MRGLALAEQFYYEHGIPMLRNHRGGEMHRVAAGLVGPGSECYGFDDQWSRDHDWGPGFCLWVDHAAFLEFGNKLQAAYEGLPQHYKGYGPRQTSPGEGHRVGVMEIERFYQTYTGLDHPPETDQEWLRIPDETLSVSTNGKVFSDSDGQFSTWRNKLKQYYPEDVRIYKIASLCVQMAQSGQYNFKRSLLRHEVFAHCYAETQFCDEALSLTFLLNKCYAPFYKWRHRAVRSLPIRGAVIYDGVAGLLATDDSDCKIRMIDQICQALIQELVLQELTDSKSDFLLDHVPSISNRLEDQSLRNRFSMVT